MTRSSVRDALKRRLRWIHTKHGAKQNRHYRAPMRKPGRPTTSLAGNVGRGRSESRRELHIFTRYANGGATSTSAGTVDRLIHRAVDEGLKFLGDNVPGQLFLTFQRRSRVHVAAKIFDIEPLDIEGSVTVSS